MIENPKILFIANAYPTPNLINHGIYVKEQIDCLVKDFGIEAKVYFINATEKGKFEYVKSIFKIYGILRRNKDIHTIHIHYGLCALFLLFYRPKAKIFLTFHGSDILKKQGKYMQVAISKYLAKKVDKVFVLNDEMEQIVKKLNIPYELLPCGIDTDFFNNGNIEKKESGAKIIVFPGDPSRSVKNYPLFEETMDILRKHNLFKVKEVCVNNLTRTEVRDLLKIADCIVMTSISEGSPQIIKEALSCNLPVISVPVGDVATLIKDISSCYVSINHNALELADLTQKSLGNTNPNIRTAFLEKGIYDNKRICQRLLVNYQSENI